MMQIDRRTFGAALGGMAALGGGGAVSALALASHVRARLYDCEGCEAVSERAATALPSHLRLAPMREPGERMILEGRVLLPDGRTPAAGVVVYAHHTDAQGLYSRGTGETEWSR